MYRIVFTITFILISIVAIAQDGTEQINQIDEADYLAAGESYLEAKAFYSSGAYRESIKSFTKANQLNPNNSDYLFGRAMSYYELKKLDSAKVDIEQAIALAPGQPDYHLYAGNIYFKSRKYALAISNYEKAIKYQGNEDVYIDAINAEFNMATCYLLSDLFAKAVESFSKVLEQDEEFGDAYYNRAFANLKLGKKEAACSDFKIALSKGVEKAREKIAERCR